MADYPGILRLPYNNLWAYCNECVGGPGQVRGAVHWMEKEHDVEPYGGKWRKSPSSVNCAHCAVNKLGLTRTTHKTYITIIHYTSVVRILAPLSRRTPDQLALWTWVDYETFDWRTLQGWSHTNGAVIVPTAPGAGVLIGRVVFQPYHTSVLHGIVHPANSN